MPGTYQYDVEIKSNVAKLLSDMKQVQDRLDTVEGKEYKIKLNVDEKKLSNVISNLEKMLDSLGKGTGDFKQFENLSKELSSIVSEVQSLSKAFGKVDDSGAKTLLSSIQNIDKSLSELSQNILNVNKNMSNMGGNTSGTVKQVENISNAYQNAAKEAEKLADAQSKIGQKTNNLSASNQKKDAFPKTSENLEQVAKSEQKVQQEAVATDKALDNISFTPNTEGFDDIIAKFGILREQAEQITKIVKTTKQTADGTPNISYKATLRNGSSYYLGENSTPQVLNASETVYDTNSIEKAYQEATKVNNALNETNSLLNSLKIPNGFEGSFSTLESEVKRLNSEFTSGRISATEYANSIKKAFGNYQTPIDNKSKDIWNDLTTSLNRYATLQKRIASNDALSTDNEEATKLLEHIHELQRNDILPTEKLTASNEKLQQINQTVADLKAKLKESTLDSLQGSIDKYQKIYDQRSTHSSDFTPSEQYTKNLAELETAIKNLVKYRNELKNVSEVTVEQEAELKRMVAACEKASDSFKSLSASEKGASQIAIDKLVQRINKDLDENTNYSKRAKLGLRALRDELESANPRNLKEITSEIINIENAEIRAGRTGRSFFDIFKDKKIYSFIGQAASMFSFYDLIRYGREGIDTLKEFDDGLTKISYTMDMTKSQLDGLGKSVLETANDIDSSIDNAMQVSQIYANMNTSAEEIKKLSEPTLILSNLTGFDSSTVADDIQAVTQQFEISAEESMHIADVYDQISRNISVDYSKGIESIAEAVQVAGSTSKQAGLSFEQLAAIVGKTAEKTRLEGSQIGNGLKTIMTRLSKVGELSDEVDPETLSDASESLHKIGIEVYNADGSFREFDVIMGELANKWDTLSDAEKSNISFSIAATRQTNLLSSILSNFSDSMSMAEEATNANGNALENNQKWVDSFGGHLQSLENTAKSAWINILDSETIKGGADILNSLLKVVVGLVDTFGLLPTTAGIGGIVAGFKNIGREKCYPSYRICL